MISKIHIITGLNQGGAETMLYKLLKSMDKAKYDIKVISMMDEGIYGPKIRELGVDVYPLNMNRGIPSPMALLKARQYIKDADIVQTWLYHADLFGYLITRFSNKKLIWGIRHSNLEKDQNNPRTIKIAKINAKLSKKVDCIVSNSLRAKETHRKIGYHVDNFKVIPNGFDFSKFYKMENGRTKVNDIINNQEDLPIITHVGRWDILKDYPNLIKSLYILKEDGNNFKVALCGANIDSDNSELVKLIREHELEDNITLLGRRDDIPIIMSGSDLFVLSSSGEGFPNVVGEAMACETPCVVTDVGDTKMIVADTGIVVPPQDPIKLANGIGKMLAMKESERNRLGKLARERVVQEFSIENIRKQYEELYNLN